jgi:hypothetical protein
VTTVKVLLVIVVVVDIPLFIVRTGAAIAVVDRGRIVLVFSAR